MKKLLILLFCIIMGYLSAQPACGNGCTTCPGLKICDVSTCNCQNTVPVELLQFAGISDYANRTVKINWVTLSEVNSDYYVLERSLDCITYTVIGMIAGSGNSITIRSYNLVDDNPVKGVSYYRLKQCDYDGNYVYSNIIPLEFKDLIVTRIEAYDLNNNKVSFMELRKIYIIYQYYSDGTHIVEKVRRID